MSLFVIKVAEGSVSNFRHENGKEQIVVDDDNPMVLSKTQATRMIERLKSEYNKTAKMVAFNETKHVNRATIKRKT